ncbi:MAG: YhgE/Pip domain-containing protein [Rothia sp.]|uniref:YhgE/Pip domain-containing protein n=1 Tax=Rothia sp. (in: high G+C Gram-positive bacteria) TaxID=1885016 RepID=UPI001CAFAC54|nr:YhgE/Pip domain-containing protein [Rothia sp. (in: high G+C Gram-positive bacteria)]MBF1676407.1 YhgE/Pip domain-containing protein [Rothia sp. (in: high G+C Gram-positive bacteria)]
MTVLRVALVELKRLTSGVLPVLVLIAMSCIPLLYGALYLYGNWDAYGHVNGIVGALVVEDEGATDSSGQQVNTGADVKKNLLDAGTFDWRQVPTREEAVDGVEKGTYDFALVIPKNFSRNLQSAAAFKPDANGNTGTIDPQSAGIEIVTNDANNYVLTNIVTKAGTSVRDSVASKVGNATANALLASFTTIHSKMGEAASGAEKVNTGTVKLADAIVQLKDGSATVNDGALKLKDGTVTLSDGTTQLVDAQKQLADGADKLASGAATLDSGAAALNSGAAKLVDGSTTLKNGTSTLASAAASASDGASKLKDGSATLAQGTSSLKDGSATLAQGANSLAEGTHKLRQGLDESGIRELPGQLNAMCQHLQQTDTSAPSGDFGRDLSNTVVSASAQRLRERLAPMVAAGTMTQQQADELVSSVDSDEFKGEVATLNQKALESHLASRSATAADAMSKLQALKSSHCVADGSSSSAAKIQTLVSGVDALDAASTSVAKGASSLAEGAARVDSGASSLASGAATLADGNAQIASGASSLASGASSLAEGTENLKSGTDSLKSGTATLKDGTSTLAEKEQSAVEGQQKVADGASNLKDGASQLTEGTEKLASGTDQLNSGASELKDGTSSLQSGLASGTKQVPNLSESEQTKVADTMSNPVTLSHDSLASGRNYGEGMGPFFMCLALWIGGLMLVQTLRVMNNRALASHAPSVRVMLGSWMPFGLVGIAQATLMFVVIKFGLGFEMAHPWLAWLFLCFAALVFTGFIHGLTVFLGAPGKLVALVVLILQLVTGGGTMPYETLPEPIRWMHDFFPMGYAVTGMRRLSYGVNESSLWGIMLVLALWGLAGLLLGYLGTRRDRTWSLKKLAPEITV